MVTRTEVFDVLALRDYLIQQVSSQKEQLTKFSDFIFLILLLDLELNARGKDVYIVLISFGGVHKGQTADTNSG